MARFRGTVTGNRSQASRLGHPSSGLVTEANGWNCGVKVHAFVAEVDGQDCFGIFATGGSNGAGAEQYIGHVHLSEGRPIFVPYNG